MKITEQIKCTCMNCGQVSLYSKLVKKRVITINKIETRYIHSCPICNSEKFKILSIVISS